MNVQSLYYFIAVAQELNISQTARRLYISQQALSEQIRKLEKQYGAVFFERRPRFKLTYQGEQMLAYARSVVQAEQLLAGKLRSAQSGEKIKLSIAAPSDSALAALPHVLEKYMAKHPNVVPAIHTGTPGHLREQLEEERIDVYFGPQIRLPSNYATERITRDDLYFIVSRRMLAAELGGEQAARSFAAEKRRGISIAEACRFPIALPPAETTMRTAIELACMQQGETPNLIMETSSNEMMFDVCSMGTSSSFVTRQLLFSRIREGRFPETMLYFPATGLDEGAWSCAACRKGAAPDYIADFMKCCRETLQEIEAQMQELLPQGEE